MCEEKDNNRISEDKILNAHGKLRVIWCRKNGMCILNVDFWIDEDGKYTFVGHGEMVIDYSLFLCDVIYEIDKFTINNRIDLENLPLDVKWKKIDNLKSEEQKM